LIILAHKAQEIKEPIDPKFGVEIDVRDHHGHVMMGHDPIIGSAELLSDWVKLHPHHPMYAVNVKADGFERQLVFIMNKLVGAGRWFAFDMSYPTLKRLEHWKAPIAHRLSDEETPALGPDPERVWWDQWSWDEAMVPAMTSDIYVVSPELHGRDDVRVPYWERFKRHNYAGICTGHPDEAWEYFNA
tara:strand:+ start:84 stop:644 length:561 start_codon:yes stop_codon:yes gene_type:complete